MSAANILLQVWLQIAKCFRSTTFKRLRWLLIERSTYNNLPPSDQSSCLQSKGGKHPPFLYLAPVSIQHINTYIPLHSKSSFLNHSVGCLPGTEAKVVQPMLGSFHFQDPLVEPNYATIRPLSIQVKVWVQT